MVKSNPHFKKLSESFIFPVIDEKLAQLKASSPKAEVLNLGIGDISRPLRPSITQAIKKATDEMGTASGIHGYGPSAGYPFLRKAIAEKDYPELAIAPDEVFVSDGINSDCCNLLEIFAEKLTVGVPDPAYPAYLDAALIGGHKVITLPCLEETGFLPYPPATNLDIIYLCSPHNPTGTAFTRDELKNWVDFARDHGSIILFDAAYEVFVSSPDVPRSIYEIPGAKECAIEMRSFSKSAGFTGLRLAYTVVPKTLGDLHPLWQRRQNVKYNGAPYPIQMGALAALSDEGRQETARDIAVYKKSAEILHAGLKEGGYTFAGGIDSPYIWLTVPNGQTSWDFFDELLEKHQIVAIPGPGFGASGEGFIRLSAFINEDIATETIKRLCH